MKSQHLLSNDEYAYITSQKDIHMSSSKKSQCRTRIQAKVAQAFKTFEFVLKSEALSQKQKDAIFTDEQFKRLLRLATHYERSNSVKDENNKQSIARIGIAVGLEYYKTRYALTRLLSKKIEEAESLLGDLDYVSLQEQTRDEAIQLYLTRGSVKLPPRIVSVDGGWQAMCVVCWRTATGKTKDEAMKQIRHEAKCTYDRRDLDWCIRTYPPLSRKAVA